MLQLLAVVEPSKTAWYVTGGALAVWAVLVSFIGLKRPDFPGNDRGARLVMLISFVLVVTALTSAVASG